MTRLSTVVGSLLIAVTTAALPSSAADVQELVAEGDGWWARRAEGHEGDRAAAEPIARAVGAYTGALEAAPEDLEVRWRLLRALYFQGEYATVGEDEKLAIFERGRTLGEEGLDLLAEPFGGRAALDAMEPAELATTVGDRTLAAQTYFWAAAHWGLWGQVRGKLAAARQGVAGKVRDYAERVIALDETLQHAGGHRVLGRLHSEAPKIPFVTGWVDHDKAIAELERTQELAPSDLLTRVYWAEAVLEHDSRRSAEAVSELRAVSTSSPDPEFLVEELHAIAEAKRLLAEHAG
ncbi:MAG: TRAP transporter TatT component family protein [Thermoanaerobaculia bacterium]